MQHNYRRVIMWAVYGLFFLFILLLQTVVLGDMRLGGAKLNLLPVALICVTVYNGHEAGGLFGLLAGFFWACAGGQDGALAMVTFTVCGILSGWLCDTLFARRFFPALFLSLGALVLHQGAFFLLQRWMAGAEVPVSWFVRTVLYSWPAVLICCPVCKLIRKAGGD